MSDPWTPLIAAVAPTWGRLSRADHPALPVTVDEIAADAAACRDAGASLIHLHVRDADNGHTLDADAYRTAIKAIREAVGDGLIIQVTTESMGLYEAPAQMAAIRDLRPEAVSMMIRELVPDAAAEAAAAEFFAWLEGERIFAQYILFSAEEVIRFADLRRRGVVPGDAVSVLYVLGRYKPGRKSEPADLLEFLEAAGEPAWHWSMCAFGAKEGAAALTAAALGGHARVGFENNRLLADGALAPDNAALVAQLVRGARLMGRPLADADAARALLSAPPGSL